MLHCNPEFLHVVRPKTPRGDGNHRGSPALDHAPLVVSSDPKPREGTETFRRQFVDHEFSESSDPKPREGTETTPRVVPSVSVLLVVRPKTPRGDGNLNTEPCTCRGSGVSSDPKPREGTETFLTTCAGLAGLGRQTQNPERGRKPASGKSVRSKRFQRVVRPKTPRGDGNLHPLVADTADFRESSDPKPREGTETGNCVTARLAGRLSSDPKPREGTETPSDAGTEVDDKPSSDPKPREGTETSTPSVPHTGPVPCRQTQNPERGRKPDGTELSGFYQVVVRPKTPRGDGNPSWWDMDERDYRGRQTQNPERGRKLDAESHRVREVQQSSDPKPREGTETHIARHTTATLLLHVLRPKTPRGDGNTPP
ncbi:hypothetical protein AN57_02919, partial [Mycobacterium tuberculosis M1212]